MMMAIPSVYSQELLKIVVIGGAISLFLIIAASLLADVGNWFRF
jgi:hypothetical protein